MLGGWRRSWPGESLCNSTRTACDFLAATAHAQCADRCRGNRSSPSPPSQARRLWRLVLLLVVSRRGGLALMLGMRRNGDDRPVLQRMSWYAAWKLRCDAEVGVLELNDYLADVPTHQIVTLCHADLTYIFNFWHSGTLALRTERQSARMSEIENWKL